MSDVGRVVSKVVSGLAVNQGSESVSRSVY